MARLGSKHYYFILVVSLVSLLISSCSQETTKITIAGSRSVSPVVQELVDHYTNQNEDVQIDVQGIGSSAGVEAVLERTADIGMVSRDLTAEEAEDLVSYTIAIDAVAIVIHPSNNVNNLTTQQIRDIFSGSIENWSEVGGEDLRIVVIDKEAGSGTKEVFEELLMGETQISPNAIIMDGTAAARTAVASDPAAIGYISLASVNDEVKAVALDGIQPSTENVISGSYTLLRPFVLITSKGPSSQVTEFINYVLGSDGQTLIENAGLIRVR